MGKKNKHKLVITKNSGDGDLFDIAINIIFENNYEISSIDFKSKMLQIMKSKNIKGVNPTSIIHKTDLPRYFGLMKLESNWLYLTEFGINYAMSKTLKQKIEVIFDAIETVSFGRDNNVVGSDSNVEPPIVYLKMLMDLGACSQIEFGCMLYYLEARGTDYETARKFIKTTKDLLTEKKEILNDEGGKFFDTKFHLFFESLGLVESSPDTGGYKLSSYVKENYQNRINGLVILNSNDISFEELDLNKQTKNYQQTTKEKKNVNEEVRKFIKEYDNTSELTKPSTNIIKKRVSSKIKKTKNLDINIGRNKKKNEMSDKTKFDIGWRGEEYIYKLIYNNEKLLLDELDFSYDEEIKSIDWFNCGFRKDPSWEDKSKGKGCDIEVKTNLRNIKIEVKTSWDNINYYTVTTNELISMDKNEENYFLTKINKFYNSVSNSAKPKLTVINNPITLIKNLDNIKTIMLKI